MINSDKADFFAGVLSGRIVFVSSRESQAKDRTHTWTEILFLPCIIQGKGNKFTFRNYYQKNCKVNSMMGQLVLTNQVMLLYLTRNNSTLSNRADRVVKLK
ncbi:MAG: hypothetical protein IPP71_07300 [Bacteroidetes bacterium]|nr:hypothetical protein [Bacteroidota bacterium]